MTSTRLLRRIFFAALILATTLPACKAQKKGRRQPTHGPIPCPIKDC